ncbi:hypothetical protein [Desertivirga arenae]|uniref:hypothetical protein n=1 Tax=Desertivirga arenae TaxID=2810309 RepID=UPI001A960542|nr:hypothetical protein [Pedobacter sp. SYSU D00823]
MVSEVGKEVWNNGKSSLTDSVFFEPDFLQVIAESFHYKVHYLLAAEDGNILAAAAIFTKGVEIVIPLTFTYSSILIDSKISERRYLEVFQNLLKYMQGRWRRIQLRIGGGEIRDMRPFLWTGFEVKPKFTYIKDVTETEVHKSVESNFKKVSQGGVSFKVEKPGLLSIERNLAFLTKQGLSKKEVKPYFKFFDKLAEAGFLVSFNAYKNEELVCSNLVLLDGLRKAYTLLIHKGDIKDIHTYIYIQGLKWMSTQRVKLVDYCGANLESIANFKSYFNPVLQPYFLVVYDERKHNMKLSFEKLKAVLKQVIGRK